MIHKGLAFFHRFQIGVVAVCDACLHRKKIKSEAQSHQKSALNSLTTPETTPNVYTRTLLRVAVLAQRPRKSALSSTATPSVTSSSTEYFGSLKLLAVTAGDGQAVHGEDFLKRSSTNIKTRLRGATLCHTLPNPAPRRPETAGSHF